VTSHDTLLKPSTKENEEKQLRPALSILMDNNAQHFPSTVISVEQINQCCSTAFLAQTKLDLSEITHIELSIQCVSLDEMSAINLQFRDKDSPTNILSFESDLPPLTPHDAGGKFLAAGDLVLCPEVISMEAHSQGKTDVQHWQHLLVHGTLHLCGYDHEEKWQAIEMERLEISVLEALGVSDPYLITE